MFFFEKKNQKTFAIFGRRLIQAPQPDSGRLEQKFFGSFFQKRTFFLPSRHKKPATILLASLCVTAHAAPYNAAPWLADFTALQVGMQDRYANLAWFAAPQGGVDLPERAKRARAALQAARSDDEARHIILAFVDGLHDGHFSPVEDDPPAGAAAPEPAKPALNQNDPATGCAVLGYAARGRFGFSLPLESLPGFKLLEDGLHHGFPAGLLPLAGGQQLAILRIPEFRETSLPWSCLDAWPALRQNGTPITVDSMQDAAQRQTLAALAAQLKKFAGLHAAAVLIDIGNNGGGNDLADWIPRLLTNRPVHSARMFVIRSPQAIGYADDQLQDLRKPMPAGTSQATRAAIASATAQFESYKQQMLHPACNMAWVWQEQRPFAPGSACSRLIAAGFASGPVDYVAPHALGDAQIAQRFYWPAVADDMAGAWTGKTYVLMNDHSYSAAELFASSMQANHVGKLMGEQTGGDGCGFVTDIPPLALPNSHLAFRVPNCLRLRADGGNEQQGVPPDLPLTPLKGESSRARAARGIGLIESDLKT